MSDLCFKLWPCNLFYVTNSDVVFGVIDLRGTQDCDGVETKISWTAGSGVKSGNRFLLFLSTDENEVQRVSLVMFTGG